MADIRDRQLFAIPHKTWKNYLYYSPSPNQDKEQVYQVMKDLQNLISRELEVTVTMAISESILNVQDIYHAGRVVHDLIRYRAIYGGGSFLHQEITSFHSDKDFQYPRSLDKKVCEAVKLNKQDLFEEKLDDFFKQIKHREIDTFSHAVTQLLLDVMAEMNTILKQNRGNVYPGYHYPDQLHRMMGIEEYHDLFLQLYKDFQKQLETLSGRSRRGEKIVQQVRDTIEQHLDEPSLDLTYLSEELKFSANYLSRIFKDETGQNITAFIREVRMKKAAELLQTAQRMSIQEVAQACGYGDVNYFSFSFRQLYGNTPSAYRQGSTE